MFIVYKRVVYQDVVNEKILPDEAFHVDAPTTSIEPSLDKDTDDPKLDPSTDENLSPRGKISLSSRLVRSQTRATPLSPNSNMLPPLPPQATLFPSAEMAADQPSSSLSLPPNTVCNS